VIMMLNLNKEIEPHKKQLPKVIAAISAGILMLSMVYAVKGADQAMLSPLPNASVGLVQNLGNSLYREYMLPFEVSSILFLAAMVGAVFLSKKDLN
jgi:NADH-quinone oxidoreductase subunit J